MEVRENERYGCGRTQPTLKMEGGMSQEMQVTSRSGEGKEMDSPLKLPERLLTSRIVGE